MLRIHNWEKWQSYRKDRGAPPWIKIHRELMTHAEWVMLTDAERGQLVAIWILAGTRNGDVHADAELLRRLCHMSAAPNLQKFIDLGFLDGGMASSGCQVVVTLASSGCQHDAPETETETETETDTSPLAMFVSPAQPKPKKPKSENQTRATRLTLDTLPTEWMEFCQQERPDIWPGKEWQIFADYWRAQPGQKGVKVDWFATWRNWIRKTDGKNTRKAGA